MNLDMSELGMFQNLTVPANYTLHLTAGGAFLLPHGNRDGVANGDEVGPPAASERGR